MMDDNFAFWYPVIIEVQLGLDGKEFPKEVLKTGHILYRGRPMCGIVMEVAKNKTKKRFDAETVKEKTVKLRVAGTKICADCQEKYKENEQSAWSSWTEGKALKVTSTEKPAFSVSQDTR
jgi:hypothetical protein